MSDLPKSVTIKEEGPREGFQIEPGSIPTARKIELVDALSETGLKYIQVTSFVNPNRVPGMADAEEVVKGFTPKPGVTRRFADGYRGAQPILRFRGAQPILR